MDKSLAIKLLICILLFFILLNLNECYSSLKAPLCFDDVKSTYCCILMP